MKMELHLIDYHDVDVINPIIVFQTHTKLVEIWECFKVFNDPLMSEVVDDTWPLD